MSEDARQAMLELVATVIDQPKWPEYDAPFMPAAISLKVVWKATGEKIVVEDAARHFRFEGYRAIAQAEAKVSVPSLDFSWKSDPIETSRADFAVIGTEINGKYFDDRKKG